MEAAQARILAIGESHFTWMLHQCLLKVDNAILIIIINLLYVFKRHFDKPLPKNKGAHRLSLLQGAELRSYATDCDTSQR